MNDVKARVILVVVFVAGVLIGGVPARAQEADDEAMSLYYSANSLCSRNLFKLAVTEYKEFLTKYPNHAKAPKAQWGLAVALYNLGDLKQAEPLLGKLAKNLKIVEQDQLHNVWGSCLLEMDRLPDAENAFGWTIKNAKDPKSKHVSNARIGLIRAQFRQRKWVEVIAASDEMLKVVPDAPLAQDARYRGAVARLNLERYAPAMAVLEQIIAKGKSADLVHCAVFHQGVCKEHTGKLLEATALYETAAKTRKGAYSERAQFNLGMVLFDRKEYVKAVVELTLFGKSYPKSEWRDEATLYLGRAHLEVKDYGRAGTVLGALAGNKKGAQVGQATLWYARTYARQKKWDIVVRNLAKAMGHLQADPAMPGLLYELGTAQMHLGKHTEAASAYAKAFATGKDPALRAEFLRMQAHCLYRAGQFDQSINLCRQFLREFPTDPKVPEVIFCHAEDLMLLKKGPEALERYSRFLTVAPKHPRAPLARFRRGQILSANKKWKLAAADFEAVLAGEHGDAIFDEARYLEAKCYFQMELWDKVIAANETFIKEKPAAMNVDRAMFDLALACQRKGQPDKAIEVLTELIEDEYGKNIQGKPIRKKGRRPPKGNPRQPRNKQPLLQQARIELGKLLYDAGEYPRAKAVLLDALKTYRDTKTTGDGTAEYRLAWIAMKENNTVEAAKYFEVLKKYPGHSFTTDSSLQAAIILIRTGKLGEAQQTLQRILKDKPRHVKADQITYYLGICHARQNRHAQAIEHFKRVLVSYPKSDVADDALFWRGQCEERLSKIDGVDTAIATYKAFLTRHPDSEMLGDVIVDLSRLEHDKKLYEQVIKRLTAVTAPDSKVKLSPALLSQAQYLLGWAYFAEKKMLPAAVAFEAVTAMGKTRKETLVSAYFQAGEARRRLKEYEQAFIHFTKAVAMGRGTATHESAMLRKAQCEALTNRWRESHRTCQEFIKAYKQSKLTPQIQYQLGWSMQNQKQYPQAIVEYHKALAFRARDENAARSQFQLGECLLQLNKLNEAVAALIRVEANYAFPSLKAMALVEIGRIMEMQKKPVQAIARYKEVISRFGQTTSAKVAKKRLDKLQ